MPRKLLATLGSVAILVAVGGGWYAWSQPPNANKIRQRFDYKIHTFSPHWQKLTMNAAADGFRFDIPYLQGGTSYHVSVSYSRPDSFRVTIAEQSAAPDFSSWALCNTNDRDIEYRGHDEYQRLFLTCLSKVAVNSLRYAVGH